MFGYVTICKPTLAEADYDTFRAFYCGLCKQIGKYHQGARLGLSYDMTFLAILLSAVVGKQAKIKKKRCLLHPFAKRNMVCEDIVLSYAAKMSILLQYEKLLDDWKDEKKPYALSAFLFRRTVRSIQKDFPHQSAVISECLKDLSRAEKENLQDVDMVADRFAKILEALFVPDFIRDEQSRKILSWLGYNLGRWIYLLDAAEDLEKDIKRNSYNPFSAKIRESETDQPALYEQLDVTLTFCLANIAAAYDLLSVSDYDAILKNILFDGVRMRQDAILKQTEEKNGSV